MLSTKRKFNIIKNSKNKKNENKNEKIKIYIKTNHIQENSKNIIENYDKSNNLNKIIKIQSIIKGRLSLLNYKNNYHFI